MQPRPDPSLLLKLFVPQGVHYGLFPGATDPDDGHLASVWNVVRPHNWHPSTSEEFLLQLDAKTGGFWVSD